MNTFNDNIRRQLGFGLISWNMPEHRPSTIPSQLQSGKPARAVAASPTATLAGPAIVSGVR